jgi:hypothetical protein
MGVRRVVAAVSAAALIAGTAGCGSEEISPSAVARAAEATAAVDGARMKVSFGLTLPGLGHVTVPARGESSMDGKRFGMTFDVSDVARTFGLPGKDLAVELVYADSALFVRPPAIDPFRLPGGKRWAKVDLFAVARALDFDLEGLAPLVNPDPAAQLRLLAASSEFEKVGKETIDGVATTRYRGIMRMRDAVKAVPEAQRERLRAAIDKFLELSDDRKDTAVGFEMWIDGDDQIRRMIQSGTFPMERGEPPAKMTIRMDLTDLGTPIALKAPPAGEVLDVTEAVGRAAREIAATK